jgi:6-pyruvoyltetrahydropterin/6-carboxytetrahydropterin synthase
MNHITCTRRLEFDAAHRVMLHESKCKYLHGHRYVIEATFTASELDNVGRVIDFGSIKQILGTWIDTHWDHTAILNEKDKKLGEVIVGETKQEIYYLPYNPTAENIGRYLLENVCPDLFKESDIRCVHIRVHETPNCYADSIHD